MADRIFLGRGQLGHRPVTEFGDDEVRIVTKSRRAARFAGNGALAGGTDGFEPVTRRIVQGHGTTKPRRERLDVAPSEPTQQLRVVLGVVGAFASKASRTN